MRRTTHWIAMGLFVLGALASRAHAQSSPAAERAEVLVLGTYHMGNPGLDIANMQADDVLAPKRQAQIAELVRVLARFRPTKIAIEANIGGSAAAREYASYKAGQYELTRNEIDQIGYRLAKTLGHETVYAVDTDGEFPFQRVENFAKASAQQARIARMLDELQARVRTQGEYLAHHTVLETLREINSPAHVAHDQAFYAQVMHLGEPGDWAGADLAADWYRRNARIFTHIAQLIDSPQERVLVLYGAGHLGLLRRFVDDDPSLRLRNLDEFIED